MSAGMDSEKGSVRNLAPFDGVIHVERITPLLYPSL